MEGIDNRSIHRSQFFNQILILLNNFIVLQAALKYKAAYTTMAN